MANDTDPLLELERNYAGQVDTFSTTEVDSTAALIVIARELRNISGHLSSIRSYISTQES